MVQKVTVSQIIETTLGGSENLEEVLIKWILSVCKMFKIILERKYQMEDTI